MAKVIIGVLVGSQRKASFSKQVAKQIASRLPEEFEAKFIQIDDLPIYNQDLDDEGTPPPAWIRFRQELKGLDGFLFVTPEYNRSVTPLMKNALDVGSRPYGQSMWNGKPGAVVSASPGGIGGFGSNHHLRQSMTFLNVYMLQQPEAYVGGVHELLGEDGTVPDERNAAFLQGIADAFADWVLQFRK